MNNNVGFLGITLYKLIGQITNVVPSNGDYVNVISGQLGLGFLGYDEYGTVGVCTNISTINERLTYSFRTISMNTEIDVNYYLTKGY